MSNFYLYGARNDDPRYLATFQEQYGSVGEEFLSDLQRKFNNLDSENKLALIMEKGILNSKVLAQKQIKAFGYTDIDKFCQDFNNLIENFELISYRLLEYYSTTIAYDIEEQLEHAGKAITPTQDIIAKVRNEEKIVKAFENDANGAIQSFWNNFTQELSYPTGQFKGYLEELVSSRRKDLSRKQMIKTKNGEKESRVFQYMSDYAGKMGELTTHIMAKCLLMANNAFFTELKKSFRGKEIPIEITGDFIGEGGKQMKGDNRIATLVISNKNYSAIRNRFMGFQTKAYNPQPFPDITIQSSGNLETVIRNFEADTQTNVIPSDSSPIYSFIMNALYYKQFGIDEYYQIAMQALDILVNIYAYVFMVQGTAVKAGYTIEDITKTKTILPGFMWLTGKGIIPIYKILDEIKKNFQIILNKTRSQGRSGIYAYLKLRGQKEGTNAVDILRQRSVYGEEQTLSSEGMFYRKSFNSTTSKNQNVPQILAGRYKTFSSNVNTSIKLNLQLKGIKKLMTFNV